MSREAWALAIILVFCVLGGCAAGFIIGLVMGLSNIIGG